MSKKILLALLCFISLFSLGVTQEEKKKNEDCDYSKTFEECIKKEVSSGRTQYHHLYGSVLTIEGERLKGRTLFTSVKSKIKSAVKSFVKNCRWVTVPSKRNNIETVFQTPQKIILVDFFGRILKKNDKVGIVVTYGFNTPEEFYNKKGNYTVDVETLDFDFIFFEEVQDLIPKNNDYLVIDLQIDDKKSCSKFIDQYVDLTNPIISQYHLGPVL